MRYTLKMSCYNIKNNTVERFDISREISSPIIRMCYKDAILVLQGLHISQSTFKWFCHIERLLYDYVSTHENCSHKWIMMNETDYFKYRAEMSCF